MSYTTNLVDDDFISLDHDKLNEECGVFAAFNVRNASYDCFLGLNNLQHRGQEACGIVSFDNSRIHSILGMGEVSEVFIKNRVGLQDTAHFSDSLPGRFAIGHVRYSTSGKKNDANIQPVCGKLIGGEDDGKDIAVAHNGNLIRLDQIRADLISKGVVFKTTMDTEVVLHLIIQSEKWTTMERIKDALTKVSGAYSFVIMIDETIIGIRDPFGIRPLSLGKIERDSITSYFLSSETCALDIVGASHVQDIKPGEIVVLKNDCYIIFDFFEERKPEKFCIFEYIYLSRPDSFHKGKSVYEVRKRMGEKLAEESGVEADVVIPVPDSGVPAALGYSSYSKIPFDLGIIRNQYIGRTFIKPSNEARSSDLHIKHNPNKLVVSGKRVVVIDDSIVRGNTSKKIVKMLREAGAKEIHMRIACPEIKFSCLYGIDTPDPNELISNKCNIEQMKEYLGLDSLAFLTVEGMYSSVSCRGCSKCSKGKNFCDACFTGEYFI